MRCKRFPLLFITLVLQLQSNECLKALARTPQYFETTNVQIDNEPSKRLMIVCRSNGCAYKRLTDKLPLDQQVCQHCNFNVEAIDPNLYKVSSEDQLAQLTLTLEKFRTQIENGEIREITLLSSGNVLNNTAKSTEFGTDFWIGATQLISKYPHIKKLVVEGRSEYVTRESLDTIRNSLREDIALEISIGVESTNKKVLTALKKGFSQALFSNALQNIAETPNTSLHVNLLIKPIQFESEEAYISDAVKSALDVLEQSKAFGISTRIAFHPMFIAPETQLEVLYRRGDYTLPTLPSVLEVARRTQAQAIAEGYTNLSSIFIGMSDENLSAQRNSTNTTEAKRYLEIIQHFNATQELSE